jgi:hypothetical protein
MNKHEQTTDNRQGEEGGLSWITAVGRIERQTAEGHTIFGRVLDSTR